MRRLGVLLIVLITLSTALSVWAEDWTTADGKTYRNVVVIVQEDDGVRITYTGGVGKIPYYELSPELQKRFGEDYDSLVAKKIAAEKALAEATLRAQQAAEQKKERDAAAALQPQNNPPAQTASSAGAPSRVVTPQPAQQAAASPSPSTADEEPSATSPVEGEALYPGSKLSYDDNLDICLMDSPTVNVALVVLEVAPGASASLGAGASLNLRIVTEGKRPEMPDRIEGNFFAGEGDANKIVGSPKVSFVVDGTSIPAHNLAEDDGEFALTTEEGPNRISFFLTPEQTKRIFYGNKVNLSVGANDYRIDPAGIAIFRNYLADVDHLPPASTNIVRAYHRFIDRLPSVVTVISTVCEYIILGGFVLVLAASIAAFVMGMTRFLNM